MSHNKQLQTLIGSKSDLEGKQFWLRTLAPLITIDTYLHKFWHARMQNPPAYCSRFSSNCHNVHTKVYVQSQSMLNSAPWCWFCSMCMDTAAPAQPIDVSGDACRFLTRPSIPDEAPNITADAHGSWVDEGLSEDTKRRVLLSQNSVTARFEAQKLWEQGYAGAKVKVGVFDTGIRADHPHVKNIRCTLRSLTASPQAVPCVACQVTFWFFFAACQSMFRK